MSMFGFRTTRRGFRLAGAATKALVIAVAAMVIAVWGLFGAGVGVARAASASAPAGARTAVAGSVLGVGAVRFAPLAAQSANTTPGLPVIKDDGPSFTTDHEFGPAECDGITAPRDYDYLDCAHPAPSGSPAKVWPVIYPAGDALTVDRVVFVSSRRVLNPQLTAAASVPGARFRLPARALSETRAGGHYLLTGNSLTFTGALPGVPGRDTLTISWTVTSAGSGSFLPTARSSHVVYVTAAKYAAPAGLDRSEEKPFVTVLNTGTAAASGVSGVQNVFDAIWREFTTLSIKHAILNPVTGSVSGGKVMTYYNNGFTTLPDGFNGDRNGCTELPGMLHTDSGHCGAWAAFFAMVMAFQGIPARWAVLGEQTGPNGYQPGPSPGRGCTAMKCAYMLVDPGLWRFRGATGRGIYRFRDKLTVTAAGAIDITGSEVTYSSTSVIAQGHVTTPPMWFLDGDHAIDQVTLPGGMKWVDPSYGDPMPPVTPFRSVKSYEPHAIAGFAAVYLKTGPKLVPLPATYSASKIAASCRNATCYFQAYKGT
jgi:hypothetical protein